MPKRPSVSAVVLAAGMSTRMGTVKQLLPLGGTTLLENVLDNVGKAQVDEIVLVLGFSANAIRQQIPFHNVKIVVNDAYREGMGTSLRAGITQVSPSADAALVMLGDQPFVKPETIDQLIRVYGEQKPQIVIPVYQGFRGNPVLLDRSVFPELLGLAGDIGCRAIFGGHTENILKAPVDDIGVLLDIDTQSDFEKLQQAHARGGLGSTLLESADLTGRDVSAGPHLVLVGQEAVAKTLASLGRLMKFTVTVVDPFLTIDQAPGAHRVLHTLDFSRLSSPGDTYVVVASRGRFDEGQRNRCRPLARSRRTRHRSRWTGRNRPEHYGRDHRGTTSARSHSVITLVASLPTVLGVGSSAVTVRFTGHASPATVAAIRPRPTPSNCRSAAPLKWTLRRKAS